MSRRVFFSNVPFSTTEDTLVEVFQLVGEVAELELFQTAQGFRGMGVCIYKDPKDAQEAISRLRDMDVDGRSLWVAEDTGKKLHSSADRAAHEPPPPARAARGVKTAELPTEVFFSNVPYSTSEETLRELFNSCGEVSSLQLFRQKTGESRGMGVVSFLDPDSVQRAVQTLRDHEVGDRKMWVSTHARVVADRGAVQPVSSAKVFFSNVPFDVGEDQLRALFEEVGIVQELTIFLKPDGQSRGMGHCTFQNPVMAANAIRGLRDRDVGGRPIWIAEDVKSPGPQATAPQALPVQHFAPVQMVPVAPMGRIPRFETVAMAPLAPSVPTSARIFFSNVPFDVFEKQLEQLFRSIGPITELHLMKSADGRSRGMGHVTYPTPELAALAIHHLMDRDVGGRPILVKEDRSTMQTAPMSAPLPMRAAMPRAPKGPPSNEMLATSSKIFFSNVPYTVGEEELLSLFRQVGGVLELNLFRTDEGRSRGMGHCLFQTPQEAQTAIQELRDVNVGGRPIWVSEDSRGKAPNSAGRTSRPRPY
ncbi:unnamed protein product [Durusdinium trenchii]|uniref:RRM domain-containing protein n=1 Tax=Durusdinium trenchii TaxID=1381693 RepID=A0ABP0RP22_9DINO